MSWEPPSSGGYGPPPSSVPPDPRAPTPSDTSGQSAPYGGFAPYGGYGGREGKALRALRALPPPPSPPPGMGAAPAFAPPVPRRDRTVLIVSLVLGVTLLVCCGGGVTGVGGFFYYAYRTVQNDAVDAVDGYLGELRSGQYAAAYNRLCTEARVGRSVDRFTTEAQRAGQILSYRVGSTMEVTDDGGWAVVADVTRQGKAARPETYPVVFNDANVATVCPG